MHDSTCAPRPGQGRPRRPKADWFPRAGGGGPGGGGQSVQASFRGDGMLRNLRDGGLRKHGGLGRRALLPSGRAAPSGKAGSPVLRGLQTPSGECGSLGHPAARTKARVRPPVFTADTAIVVETTPSGESGLQGLILCLGGLALVCYIPRVTLASTGELRLRARERPRPRGCTVGTPPGMRRGPGLLSPAGGRAHRHPKGGNPDPAPPGLPTAGAVAEVGAGGACRAVEGQPQGSGPALRPGCSPA